MFINLYVQVMLQNAMLNTNVAVEVLGARTRVGHRTCTRASCTSATQGHCVGERLTI